MASDHLDQLSPVNAGLFNSGTLLENFIMKEKYLGTV